MENLSFKEWLVAHEATTTSSVASFARPIASMIRRKFSDVKGPDESKSAVVNSAVDKTVGAAKGIFNFFKNKQNSNSQKPTGPMNGDELKIFYLYKGNGTYLVSTVSDGRLRIEKDGSVHIQHDNNQTSKISNSIQQANLQPNGNRSWKINKYLD